MNELTIIGKLIKDPILRSTKKGIKVCDFIVAADDEQSRTDNFHIAVWNERAEVCADYLTEGCEVKVIGPVRSKTYIDKNGIPRSCLEVSAEDVELLSTKSKSISVDKMTDEQVEATFKKMIWKEAKRKRRMIGGMLQDDNTYPF